MKLRLLLLYFILGCTIPAKAQDLMMQGWYWDYPKTCNGFNWANTLNSNVADLAGAGYTHVWLPPASRASFGSCSNGYDPQDLYDLGEFGQGPTGFGTRADVDALIAALQTNGIDAVADVVYNHRDGGAPENNPAVANYIQNYTANKSAFPSDRYRCVLPLGGMSGNGAGDYYFKVSSGSGDAAFFNKPYTFYVETNTVGNQNLPSVAEAEPNGGGDCGEAFNTATLGVYTDANVDGTGCLTDEFKVTINAGDFNPAGDFLYIFLTNPNGDYSDHRVYGIWNASAGADVVGQMEYQTYTDFTNMPSGQGAMNFENFKPNSGNTNTTWLAGDWDWLWFFYDYDQYVPDTRDKLFDWTKWLWNDVGFRGFRMDAVKHFDPVFIGDLMDDIHDNGIDPGMVVGEVYDSNPNTLKAWLDGVRAGMDADTDAAIKVKVFDFALREALKNSSDLFGYDVRNVFNSGLVDGVSESSFHVVTFLNNHDFRDAGQPVQNDPILGYAYLLTNNQIGVPCVFYPDYYGVSIPNAPTSVMKPDIDELWSIHQNYIFGSTSVDYLSQFGTSYSANYTSGFPNTTLLYQLTGGVGGKEVVVAINYAGEPLILDHQINMTNLPPGTQMTELTGNALQSTTTVNGAGEMHIEVPARSYAVWINDACATLDLTLNFDAAPQQTSWEILDDSGNVVASGGTYAGEPGGSTLIESECLPDGCYDLVVSDSANDGMCPRRSSTVLTGINIATFGLGGISDGIPRIASCGNYTLTDPSGTELASGGGRFGSSETNSFCLSGGLAPLIFEPNPTQLNTINASQMRIVPNLVNDRATLYYSLETNEDIHIQIMDVTGKILQQYARNFEDTNEIQLNINHLQSGIYFVRLMSENIMLTEKFVKK